MYCIPLQVPMHVSGRFLLFVKKFGVLFFEDSKDLGSLGLIKM